LAFETHLVPLDELMEASSCRPKTHHSQSHNFYNHPMACEAQLAW